MVCLTPLGLEALDGKFVPKIYSLIAPFCSIAQIETIMRNAKEPVSVGHILDFFSSELDDSNAIDKHSIDEQVKFHIMWMLKHGLLKLVEP